MTEKTYLDANVVTLFKYGIVLLLRSFLRTHALVCPIRSNEANTTDFVADPKAAVMQPKVKSPRRQRFVSVGVRAVHLFVASI